MMSFASIADPSNTSSRDLLALSQPLTRSGILNRHTVIYSQYLLATNKQRDDSNPTSCRRGTSRSR